jgi:hypothetical protein
MECPRCGETAGIEGNYCLKCGGAIIQHDPTSIPVSFDRSEGGGASIHTLERSRDGTWNRISADAFPPPRKPQEPRRPNLWLIAVVSGIVILVIALTCGVLFRFMSQ